MAEKNTFAKNLGSRIRKRRRELRLTQEELAERTELSVQFISLAENGRRCMRPENLVKLSEALYASTDYLLKGEENDEDLLILARKARELPEGTLSSIRALILSLTSESEEPKK